MIMNNISSNKLFWGGFSSPRSNAEELGDPQNNNYDGTLIVPSTTQNNNHPPTATGFDGGGGYPPPPTTQQSTTTNKSEVNRPAVSRKQTTIQQPLTNPYFNYKPKNKPSIVEVEHSNIEITNGQNSSNKENKEGAQILNNWPLEGQKNFWDTMYPYETFEKSQSEKGGFVDSLSSDAFSEEEAFQTDVHTCFAVCQVVQTPQIYWMLFDGERFTGLRIGCLSDNIVCLPEVGKWHKIKYSFNADNSGRIIVHEMEEIAPKIPLRLHGEKNNIQFLLKASKQAKSPNYRTILGEIKLPEDVYQNQLYIWASLVWPRKEKRMGHPCESFYPMALKFVEFSSAQKAFKHAIQEPPQANKLSHRQSVADRLRSNYPEEEEEEKDQNNYSFPSLSSNTNVQNQMDEQNYEEFGENKLKSNPIANFHIQPTIGVKKTQQFGFGLLDDFQPQESVQPMDENEAKKMKRVVCKMPKYLQPHGTEIQTILKESGVLIKVHPEEDPREVFEIEGPAGAIRELIEHYKWACESFFQFIEEIDLSEEQQKQGTKEEAFHTPNSSFPSSSRGVNEEPRTIHNSSSSSNGTTPPPGHGSRCVSFETSEGTTMASEIARLLMGSPVFLDQIKGAIYGSAQIPQNQSNNNNPENLLTPPNGSHHAYNRTKKGPAEKCEPAKREAFACPFQITTEHAIFALYSIGDYKFRGEHKQAAISTLPTDVIFGLGHWYKIEYSRYASTNKFAATHIHIWKMELLSRGILQHRDILERLPRVEVVEGVVQFCGQVSIGLHSQFGVVSGGVSQAELLASQGLPALPKVNFMAWFRVENKWTEHKYSLVRVEQESFSLLMNPTTMINPQSSTPIQPSNPPAPDENSTPNENSQQLNPPPKMYSPSTLEQRNEEIFTTRFGTGFSHNHPDPFATNEEAGSVHQPQCEQQLPQDVNPLEPASEQAVGVCWRLNDEKASFMIYNFEKRCITKFICAPMPRDMALLPKLGEWHSLRICDETQTIRILDYIRGPIPVHLDDQNQVLFRVEGKLKQGRKASIYATHFGDLYPPIPARTDEIRSNFAAIWCRLGPKGKFVFAEFA